MLATPGINYFRLTIKRSLKSLIHSHRLCCLRAIMHMCISILISIRSHHCNLLDLRGIHRKETIVLQKNDRLLRSTESPLIIRCTVNLKIGFLHILLAAIRLVKKANLEFHSKNICHTLIDSLH